VQLLEIINLKKKIIAFLCKQKQNEKEKNERENNYKGEY
jgi:hypothetical protein